MINYAHKIGMSVSVDIMRGSKRDEKREEFEEEKSLGFNPHQWEANAAVNTYSFSSCLSPTNLNISMFATFGDLNILKNTHKYSTTNTCTLDVILTDNDADDEMENERNNDDYVYDDNMAVEDDECVWAYGGFWE